VTLLHIIRAVTPFLLISLLVLVLVFLAPPVAVWLPNLVG
jgi:TRAP-type C4-dicarboxylate transport system permease large subunit